MGFPEPKPTRNASNVFLVLAVVSGLGLAVFVALFVLGFTFFAVAPTPATTTGVSGGSSYAASDSDTAGPTRSYSSFDLVVEIDQQGQTYYKGQPVPLEQIKPQLREAMKYVPVGSETVIQVVEGCPYEHLEGVVAMYREMGLPNPPMATIPPYRTVAVALDEEGKAAIDGEPVENVQAELQKIVSKHGSRAKVNIQAHPKCPAQFVVQLSQVCRDYGFGEVRVESVKERLAEKSE
jgi:biopolymer transport protein ExbD